MSKPQPASQAARELTLLSRPWCSLCSEMQSAVEAYAADFLFVLRVIDVDDHDHLVALYNEDVPVLFAGKPDSDGSGNVICKHRLDHAKLRQWLTG